jgi:hypothetical protein
VATSLLIERGYLKRPSVLPVSTGWGPTLANYYAKAKCPTCGAETRTTYRELMAGMARHFWLDEGATVQPECECKRTEETIVEPDGYRWQREREVR